MVAIHRRLHGAEAQIITRESYEQLYRLANHDSLNVSDSEKYFGLVLKRWAEDSVGSSRLRERMDSFLEHDVYARSGVNWTEFKHLPTYELELLLERVIAKNERVAAAHTANINGLKTQDRKDRKKAEEQERRAAREHRTAQRSSDGTKFTN